MKYEIKNRFTGQTQFIAEIECAEDAPTAIKIGLAVKWAIKARANLAHAYLAGARLAGADLAGANLAHAYLAGANLADANLARTNLAHAYLADANLADANLADANLARTNLAHAYLAGANLADANLARARLACANLACANLARADLADADFTSADLADAAIKRLVAIVQRINDPYQFTAYDTDKGLRIVAGCHNFSPEEYRAHVAKTYPGTPKADETLAIIDFIEARARGET